MAKIFKGEYKIYTVTNIFMFFLCLGLGFLSHFAFELLGENFFVGLFVPINESIWEHLKILYFPFIITAFLEFFIYGKDVFNFFSAKAFGLTAGLFSIITSYYTSVGAFGLSNMATNISIYIFALILAYVLSYYKMLKPSKMSGGLWETGAIFLMAVYFSAFVIFTYYPPHIPLFRDPTTMNYSINK